jgi:hypothetical protein
MECKKIVREIENLPWNKFSPTEIIYVSYCTAVEFAESLRKALVVYPDNKNLIEMASGELDTRNLSYKDYNNRGDHWEFLEHFCRKQENGIIPSVSLVDACKYYHSIVNSFNNNERAMTIFSREQELPSIFNKILVAHDWEKLNLGFYKYYLERHIELDSKDGGHGDLTKDFFLDDKKLDAFYKSRLELYKSLY